MIRLLFADHTPFAGGAQLVLADHIAHLPATEFDVHVACSDAQPQLQEQYRQAGAKVHVIPFPTLRTHPLAAVLGVARSAWAIARLQRQCRIDVTVSNTTRASYVVTLASLFTRSTVIWWVRDHQYPRRLFRLLWGRVARGIFVSRSVRDHYVRADDPKAAVVYVGSSLYQTLATVTDAAVAAGRQVWGIAPDAVVVGYMGRLVEGKGPADLVAAIQLLADEPQVVALLCGTGQGQEHDVEADLHAAVAAQGLQGRVIFAGYQQDIALYYRMCDLFVLTTRDHEAFATTVVQAMMAGLPVIATDAGGTAELVVDVVTGRLIRPRDPAAIAEAVRWMIHDPQAAAVAQAGHDRVMAEMREEVVTASIITLYRDVSGRAGGT